MTSNASQEPNAESREVDVRERDIEIAKLLGVGYLDGFGPYFHGRDCWLVLEFAHEWRDVGDGRWERFQQVLIHLRIDRYTSLWGASFSGCDELIGYESQDDYAIAFLAVAKGGDAA